MIDRLGLSWDVLKDLNPCLVYAQVKGFAEDSPYRDFPYFEPARSSDAIDAAR